MDLTGGRNVIQQQSNRRTNSNSAPIRMDRSGPAGDGFHHHHQQQQQHQQHRQHHHMGGGRQTQSQQEMPLRMIVDAKFVGAIIGQGGANIREITKESKARCVVDVQRAMRDQSGNLEKVISIFGQPENCSKACIKVLEVVLREADKESRNGETLEPELKLRAHNQLVGRLIGKGGVTIKKIMEDTGTTVFVSNEPSPLDGRPSSIIHHPQHHNFGVAPFIPSIGELNTFNMERTITIRGGLDGIQQAEERISSKLRQSYENDLANGTNGAFSGQASVPSHLLSGTDSFSQNLSGYSGPALSNSSLRLMHTAQHQQPMPPMNTEVVHMWVPNNMVGALIGTKGVHIRNVMRLTGAHIRIEGGAGQSPPTANGAISTKSAAVNDERHGEERLVTITGTDEQQYKGQFWIYQRVAEQGYHFFDEVRLCTEVSVPSKLVGRIIGKGGQNVRELQRVTGAQVKIPEDAADSHNEDTVVSILGNFQASQAVQNRMRQLVQQFHSQQLQGGGRTAD